MAFHMTSAAAREILAAAGRSNAAGLALRVAARPAQDGSLSFGMGFDEPAEDDEVRVFDGLTVLIGAASSRWLADTVLDYVELDTGDRDFIFVQPEVAPAGGCATRTCGGGSCGSCG